MDQAEKSGNGIAIDSSGFLYVTGGNDFTIDFGTGQMQIIGLIDAFILRLNSSGVAEWSDHAGSLGTDIGFGVGLTQEEISILQEFSAIHVYLALYHSEAGT